MADNRHANSVYLLDPEDRAVFPLESFRPSRSMKKFMRKMSWRVSFNEDFPAVIEACADDRDDTWISYGIEALYTHIHEQGDAHSVEVWDGDDLIGGLYGVSQGGAFFGESMFSRRSNASKVALISLVDHLKSRKFVLLDAQFMTDHLASLGAIEISRTDYRRELAAAIHLDVSFD